MSSVNNELAKKYGLTQNEIRALEFSQGGGHPRVHFQISFEEMKGMFICNQEFMGGAHCILPEGHSGAHASGE